MPKDKSEDHEAQQQFDYNSALRRLMYVVAVGCAVIFIYGWHSPDSAEIVSVGLMASGAALLTGGLLGFLFGVPHTRDDESGQSTRKSDEIPDGKQRNASANYRANTSLEQISDWLTKILVGVGLVQIKIIPRKLTNMAAYIGKGLGKGDEAATFALTILIYFSVCGFVFGFLWSRLYLKRWFIEADADVLTAAVENLKTVGAKLTRLEQQQQADARALGFAQHLLSPDSDDVRATEANVVAAIKAASVPVRAQIFYQAQKAYDDKNDQDYYVKLQGVISILRALIASDSYNRYHQNHAQLSYAINRARNPDLQEAMKEIEVAIKIRNEIGETGWRYYDLRRARYRIQLDADFKNNQQSDSATRELILNDLKKAASGDSEKWDKRLKDEPNIQEWLKLNDIDGAMLP